MKFKNIQVSLQNSTMGEGVSNFQSDMPEKIGFIKLITLFFSFLYKFMTSANDYTEMKFIVIKDNKSNFIPGLVQVETNDRRIANVKLDVSLYTSTDNLKNIESNMSFLSDNSILIESLSYIDGKCQMLIFGNSLDKILKSMYEVDKMCNFETKKEYTSYFSYGQSYFDKK